MSWACKGICFYISYIAPRKPFLTFCRRYTALEKSGKVEKLEAAPDFASLQPLGHQEIRDAIDELNRSTDAINKQTETLRQQQDALSRLLASDGKNGTARSQLESKQDRKWATNKKTLNLAVRVHS